MEQVYIGRVAGPHGVKGAIKVFPTTDDPMRFKSLKEVIIEDNKGRDQIMTIMGVKYVNKFVVLELKEISDMDQAMAYKNAIVKVDRSEAMPLEEDEYFVQDLIGLKVIEDNGQVLGELIDVMFTGSNEVYVVEMADGDTILLPAIKECILKIDIKASEVHVHVMEGLR